MNKKTRILLVALIITCLFVGVASAGTKRIDVKDNEEKEVKNKHVTINHNGQNHGCTTGDDGKCEIDDSVKNGDEGKDETGKDCHAEVGGTQIPEFPSIALPIAATLGLLVVMRRKIQ